MSPQKRASKKVKKTKKVNKAAGVKKRAVGKKSPAKKKIVAKKKPAPSIKKTSSGKSGRGAAHHKGDLRRAALPARELGEWSDDAAAEHDRHPTLFEEEIPPDYGGSK